jgi:hypothetical protein
MFGLWKQVFDSLRGGKYSDEVLDEAYRQAESMDFTVEVPAPETPQEYLLQATEYCPDVSHVVVISQRDKHVCPACIRLDGAVAPIKEAMESVMLPYAECTNPECRCSYLPTREEP